MHDFSVFSLFSYQKHLKNPKTSHLINFLKKLSNFEKFNFFVVIPNSLVKPQLRFTLRFFYENINNSIANRKTKRFYYIATHLIKYPSITTHITVPTKVQPSQLRYTNVILFSCYSGSLATLKI